MADITQTILEGTRQMVDAKQQLAGAVTARLKRKKAAMEGIGEDLSAMGATFKKYGDWKEAKKAELDVQGVLDAERLGYATGGTPGALTAINAHKPATLSGYKAWADRRDQITKDSRADLEAKVAEGEATLKKRKSEEDAASSKAAMDAVNAHPESVSDPVLRDYLKSGHATKDAVEQYLNNLMVNSREAAKASASMERTKARNAAKATESEKDRAFRGPLKERELRIREKGNEIAERNADSLATSRENIAKMAQWDAAYKGVALHNAQLLKENDQIARTHHEDLETHLHAATKLLAYYSSQQWLTDSPEEKKDLVDKAKETVDVIRTEMKALENIKGKDFQWEELPPVPDLTEQMHKGTPIVTPDKMSEDELNDAIKAAEGK